MSDEVLAISPALAVNDTTAKIAIAAAMKIDNTSEPDKYALRSWDVNNE